jgi:hydroxymethylglutaryl-CoA lyase
MPNWISAYQEAGIPVDQVAVMATFGCNFEGHIPLERVVQLIEKVDHLLNENGEQLKKIKLADTMGWANPEQMKRTIFAIRNKWPDAEIILHLHDTRGLGMANAYSALQEGVSHFESAIGGLGGCPFAKVKGAPGNISTEDLVFMCDEMGIETGVDLAKLLECVKLAEGIFGHDLPGHLHRGGLFREIRPKTWAEMANH